MTDWDTLRRVATEVGLRTRASWGSVRERFDLNARRSETGFRTLRERFYRAYWYDAASSVGAEVEDLGEGYLRMRRGNEQTFVRGYHVRLDDHLTLEIAGNKPLIHRLLAAEGFPTPAFLEFSPSTCRAADHFRAQLDGAAVVKPAIATASGNGVTTGVDSRAALSRAMYSAARWSRRLLIEPQIEGASFRLRYLGGDFVDAVRRDAPTVTGDGKRSIGALMVAETETRLAADPVVALHPLTKDLECRQTLRAQGLRTSSVPEQGLDVVVKTVVNQNGVLQNSCVRDQVHPSIVDMGCQVVSMLGIQLAGIDVLTPDISAPFAAGAGVINEVNTTPGLHHHVLVSNEEQRLPVGELVLDRLLTPGRKLQ